jgi:hypothetical protein
MAVTTTTTVADQIQDIWSPIFMNELREEFLLPSLVSKKYEGEIRKKNDTVKISQINKPTSTLRTVGTDADSFETNVLSTSTVSLVANKRAVSAIEFEDLVEIQSLIDPSSDPEVRRALMADVGNQINDYLYSIMIPSSSSPDHIKGSQATLTNALMAEMRQAASTANWPKSVPWYFLMGEEYMTDFLSDGDLSSTTYGFDDKMRASGVISQQRYGFECFEDNSVALDTSAMAFIPEAVIYAAQTEPTFTISSLHSQKKFGYILSVDLIFGATLSIDGDKKCYQITSA